MQLFGLAPSTGVIRGLTRFSRPDGVMVGYASTATFRAAGANRQWSDNKPIELQFDKLAALPGPGVIVFQDIDQPWSGATAGELRCRLYSLGGAVGLITSGAIRDIEDVRGLEMPVYAAAVTCTHGHHYVPDIDVPVTVGGVTVYPGDLLHGDANGVVVVPVSLVVPVAELAAGIAHEEKRLLDVLRAPNVTTRIASTERARMKTALDALSNAIRSSWAARDDALK
jgi:regulator of RNase E activity RraA